MERLKFNIFKFIYFFLYIESNNKRVRRESSCSRTSSSFNVSSDSFIKETFQARKQFMVVNNMSFFDLQAINSFLNGFMHLALNYELKFESLGDKIQKRFGQLIESLNNHDGIADKLLASHLFLTGLCTRPFFFRKRMNCSKDLNRIANYLGLPVSATLKCDYCWMFKDIR